jgi:hypothetical protein
VAVVHVRFTIGELLKLIACCAVALAMFRTPAAPLVVILLAVLPGFVIDRSAGNTGIAGAALSCALGFLGLGTALYAYAYWSGDPTIFMVGPGPLGCLIILVFSGALCGAFVGTVLWLAGKRVQRPYQPILTDQSRGPIMWRGLGDGPERRHHA